MRKWIMGAALMLSAPTALIAAETLPGWIAGAWELQSDKNWGDEFWTPPRGGIMIGSGRLGSGEAIKSFESMKIGYDEAGKLAFWAFPEWNGTPAKFTMAKQSDSEVVFENAEHDYPQRVRYWREDKQLKAEISLIDGSNAMAFSFKPMGSK